MKKTSRQAILENAPIDGEGAMNYYRRIANICGNVPQAVKKTYCQLVKAKIVNPFPNEFAPKAKEKPIITGQKVTSSKRVDFKSKVLPYLLSVGDHARQKLNTRLSQAVQVPRLPFAVAVLSDIHGGGKSDYAKIVSDVEIIKNTDDFYAIIAGDVTDNFVIGKLVSVQMHQPTTLEHERLFAEWFVETLKDSIIAWISGNHDNWTYKVSGFDPYKHYLKGVNCLFDRNEILFDLQVGDYSERWCARHKWRSGSIFNPTHGMEVGWERNGMDFDVAIGGHTHIATIYREFIKHDIKRAAVLLGTYKILDEYGKECGFANTHSGSVGSGAFVYDRNFNRMWFSGIEQAAEYLNYLKKLDIEAVY